MKKVMLRVGAVTGIVALLIFFAIIFFSELAKTTPYNIIGAVCFFMFLLVGIPCIDLIFDPNALAATKHENNKNNEK